jgi:3-hydroxyisobutyrate dehydrogenase
MTGSKTIALLGTGILGRAIAERLHAVGHTVIAYNRTAGKAVPLQAQGIVVVLRPEQALAQADCAMLLLADEPAIRSVLLTPACGAALQDKAVIQMGTIAPAQSVSLQREIERLGGSYCEAPVLGSVAEATAGTLLVMVGGTEAQFSRWASVFRSLSREPRHVGPVGKAAALKLALNHLIAAEISAFALSLGLVRRAGVSVDTFMGILRESALFAPAFEKKLPRLLRRDYQHPNFSTRHLLKDVVLFLEEASGLGLTTSTADGMKPALERAIAQGLGDVDYSAVYDAINPADEASGV